MTASSSSTRSRSRLGQRARRVGSRRFQVVPQIDWFGSEEHAAAVLLLRQRRALAEFGMDPSAAHERTEETVERYEQ